MKNTLLPKTVKEFVLDILDHYDAMVSDFKPAKEILDIAVQFFTGLADGSIAIIKDAPEAETIKKFAAGLLGKFNTGMCPADTLMLLHSYLLGLVDGIDIGMEKPECDK